MIFPVVHHLSKIVATAAIILVVLVGPFQPYAEAQSTPQRTLLVKIEISPDRRQVCLGDSRGIEVMLFDADRRTQPITSGKQIGFGGHKKGTIEIVPQQKHTLAIYRATDSGADQVFVTASVPGYQEVTKKITFSNVECEWKIEAEFDGFYRFREGYEWYEFGSFSSSIQMADPQKGTITGGSAKGGTFTYKAKLIRESQSDIQCPPVEIASTKSDFEITGNADFGLLIITLKDIKLQHKGYRITCESTSLEGGTSMDILNPGNLDSSVYWEDFSPLYFGGWAKDEKGGTIKHDLHYMLLHGLPGHGTFTVMLHKKKIIH